MISGDIDHLDSFIDELSDDELDEINTGCRDDSNPVPFRAFIKNLGVEL